MFNQGRYSALNLPIFRVDAGAHFRDLSLTTNLKGKLYAFIRLRVRHITYQEQPAIAIFLENVSHYVKSLVLQCKVQE